MYAGQPPETGLFIPSGKRNSGFYSKLLTSGLIFRFVLNMSAPTRNLTFSSLRYYRYLLRGVSKPVQSRAASSSSSDDHTDRNCLPQVGKSSKTGTIVCFHPEPVYPYEYTLPLPRNEVELGEGDSALSVQAQRQQLLRFREDGPTRHELANMFHTTKHQWYPNTADKYRKPKPPKDREAI
ncbi:39S ribosomal protein L42, mitochondrial-like [Pecten maximus]|uniref:39S ribosomal protein L42, mitochondrial-like n=1 Tax=Pecten maximus TaxID=6579 RepID=UPI00145802B4|nr:39S ribosomal protein L42, mitochondrial-like [Pecten maximus]